LPEVCQAYSRADGVFVGKLTKLTEESDSSNRSVIVARFHVSTVFKGRRESLSVVRYAGRGCQPTLNVGSVYFVYLDSMSFAHLICNRTSELQEATTDLHYAERLLGKRPIYAIQGAFKGFSNTSDVMPRVTVTVNGQRNAVPIDNNGKFSFESTVDAQYDVDIEFTKDETVYLGSLYGFKEFTGKRISYSTQFAPNSCDFTTIATESYGPLRY